MPKEPKNKQSLLKKWCHAIKDKCYQFSGQGLYCIYCKKEVTSNRKSQLIQHINTELHKEMANNYYKRRIGDVDGNTNSTSFEHDKEIMNKEMANNYYKRRIGDVDGNTNSTSFEHDLCEALVSANIPWNVLNNEGFTSFLRKYTQRNVPDEYIMKTIYLDRCHQRKLDTIRRAIRDEYVWISIDETVDDHGRYFVNMVIGNLNENECDCHYHLLASKHLDQVNNGTISRFINGALRSLWPMGNENHVLLLITSAAEYMKMAGENLKVFYPNMKHIFCAAQGLKEVVDTIITSYPLVNSFVSKMDDVFSKNPYRITVYRNIMNIIELPPKDNWLESVMFYANNYEGIKQVVQSLNATQNSLATKSAMDIIQNYHLFKDLIFLKSNFYRLVEIIEGLQESQGMSLKDSFQLFNEALTVINTTCPGVLCDELRLNINQFLESNPDFNTIAKVNTKLNTKLENPSDLEGIADEHIAKYKYAPLTVYNVEKTFPAFKKVFSENVQYMPVDILEKMVVTNC